MGLISVVLFAQIPKPGASGIRGCGSPSQRAEAGPSPGCLKWHSMRNNWRAVGNLIMFTQLLFIFLWSFFEFCRGSLSLLLVEAAQRGFLLDLWWIHILHGKEAKRARRGL